MAKINLSFIKLDINIMNDSKMKVLCKMPGGSDMFKLWIGILCLGMKSGRPGYLEIGDGIPFTAELLSGELDINIPTVRLGLQTFQQLKMVEVFENEEIYITNFETHQSLDKIRKGRENTRKRVQNFRQNNKTKQLIPTKTESSKKQVCNPLQTIGNPLQTQCNTLQTQCNANVTPIEEEEEQEEEQEESYKSCDSPKKSDAHTNTKKINYSDDFNQFWECYPKSKRVGKAKAFQSWRKMKPPIDKCLTTLATFKGSKQWTDKGGQFIPHPTTWLNRGGWDDETENIVDISNPWKGEMNFEL